ncbi:MAG TPA: hypothetical protein VGK58_04635 [Lacipirellulaceae bacterium]
MARQIWPVLMSVALGPLCVPSQILADGLIFSLPPDGTWVEYVGSGQYRCEFSVPEDVLKRMDPAGKAQMEALSRPQELQETIRVSSVGVDKYAERGCRWIELRSSSKRISSGSQEEHPNPIYLLKMLIPEKYLNRGNDPLDNAVLTFFNPKDSDRAKVAPEPGFDRIRYEIERFIPRCPPPLEDETRLDNETIETAIGTFRDCEVIRGTSQFDRPLSNDGRWEGKSTWIIALHPDAPFGVVRLGTESTVNEVHTGSAVKSQSTREYKIAAKGADATTELPEGKRDSISAITRPK